jgi:hypothetical protein
MRLMTREKTVVTKQGRRAALARVDAYTCRYIDCDRRSTALIEGYERGDAGAR